MSDPSTMTEEELDAELERLDQNITFALLETDQNFAKANQIVAEKIIPEVDRFTQASSQVRKGNELWSHFFQMLQDQPPVRARPSYAELDPSDQDSTSSNSLRPMALRRPELNMEALSDISSIAGHKGKSKGKRAMNSTPFLNRTFVSDSTSDTALEEERRRRRSSPPRTIPFRPSPDEILKTPRREAAKMLADDLMHTAGAPSSDSSSSASIVRPDKTTKDDEKYWTQSDDAHGFEAMMQQRRQTADFSPFPNTPTTQRVLENYQTDFTRKRPWPEEERDGEDQDKSVGAYEFSQVMQPSALLDEQRQDHSLSSNISMISGQSGQVPRRFDLQYFPETFRTPPNSTELIGVYTIFQECVGQLVTKDQIVGQMKSVHPDKVGVLIDLLVRRKYVKRVDSAGGWTLRH